MLNSGRLMLSTGWANFAYLDSEYRLTETKMIDTIYTDFFSHFKLNGNDYLGGGCYYCTAPDGGGNTLYRHDRESDEWDRVVTEASFDFFGVLRNLIPTSEPEEVIVQREYGDPVRVDLETGRLIDTITVIPKADDAEEPLIGPLVGRMVHQRTERYVINIAHRVLTFGGTHVARSVFYESTDEGRTWQELDIQLQEEGEIVLQYDLNPAGQLMLVSNELRIYSHHNGQTQLLTDLTDRHELPGLFQIIDSEVLYLATSSFSHNYANLYRSADGGSTWEVEHTVDSSHYRQLVFTDRDHGYALIGSDRIIRRNAPTTDTHNSIGLSVYPNPATERLFLTSRVSLDGTTVLLHDMSGKLIGRMTPTGNSIGVEHLPRGAYTIGIEREGELLASGVKFVKL